MRIKVHDDDVFAWKGTQELDLPADWRAQIGREGRHDHEWNVRASLESMDGDVPPMKSFVRKVHDYEAGGIISIYRHTHWCGCWIERTRSGEIWAQEPCCTSDRVGDTEFATPLIRSLAK